MSEPVNRGFWAMYLGCLTMSHARSMHCIFHHMGRVKPGRQRTLFLTHIQHLLGQHDWPGQAVWIGIGPLLLEEDCSRLLCSRQMKMMISPTWPRGHTSEKADDWSVTWSLIQITWIGNQNYFKIIPNSTIIQTNITLNTVRFSIELMKSVASNRTWGLFLKSPETLRAY